MAHLLAHESRLTVADQVYRGLNIGAHKVAMPSDVPLHMYDVTELPSTYSVQSFVSDASDVMTGVLQRGKPPVLFGGSPMYMEWLLFGCGNAAAVDRGAREELEVRLRGMGWEAAKQFVREDSGVDPDNVQFEANDYYRLARLVRPLFCHSCARSLASSQGVTGKLNQTPAEGYKEPLHKLDYRGAFLFPTDRVALYHSISASHCWIVCAPTLADCGSPDRRCEMMVAEGFLEEVLQLMHRYGPKALLSIVGYRQAAEFLLAHEDAKPRDFRSAFPVWRSSVMRARDSLAAVPCRRVSGDVSDGHA